MYATRGYRSSASADLNCSSRKTFLAWDPVVPVGTLTIRVDSAAGLHVDELFAKEVGEIREGGHGVCEFTKLAMDRRARSPQLLASLFHVAYLFAYRIRGLRHLFIEVNPRHVRYYETMLGFGVICAPRHNSSVNAPAVLMVLDLRHAEDQIIRFAGQTSSASTVRSAYPFFFGPEREDSIVERIENKAAAIASVYEPGTDQPDPDSALRAHH